MRAYEKGRLPQIVFGSGKALHLANYLKSYDIKKCLIVSGRTVIRHPLTVQVLEGLTEAGIAYDTWAQVPAEPTDLVCIEIAEEIKKNQYDCVVAIGGGSPMDAAKAATQIAGIPEAIEDLHEYDKSAGSKMKECWTRACMLVLMPTTSGSGAETTASGVISSVKHGLKFSFGNRNIGPDIAIIDPDFTIGMPVEPTVYGGVDALAHSTEILVGIAHSDYVDLLLLECVERVWKWLPVAVKEPDNREAREQLSWAAHNALANGGIPNGHAVAHAVGSLYHLVHGHACMVVLPVVIRHFAETSQEQIQKIAARIGVPVTGDARTDAYRVAEAIVAFYKSFGMKPFREALADLGYNDDLDTFTERMIPAVLDDLKSHYWLPPIHGEEDRDRLKEVCRMIYEEV